MHTRVQSVQLDAERTCWTRTGLRVGLLGGRSDHDHPIEQPPRPGVFDVLVDGAPVQVRPGGVLPPPILIDGHLVAPIVRPPDDRLALDVDETDRPITRSWRPKPADLRCESSTSDGLGIALDLELTAGRTDHPAEAAEATDHPGPSTEPCARDVDDAAPSPPSGPSTGLAAELPVELVLRRGAREHVVPARLVPGPGTVGRLCAELPSALLRPGENWMLALRTARTEGRLGVDLAVSAAGQPYARPTTAVTVLIVLPAPTEGGDVDQQSHGRQVGDCIGSALDQTLPREHYEVLVADQGGAEGTAGLLDWLATLHPRLRVLHLEPGGFRSADGDGGASERSDAVVRRAVGAARGEFVYFLELTDRLTPNALRDLVGFARLHDADIVAGPTVSGDRKLAPRLFRRSLPYATVHDAGLTESLTPDKLFRTSLLDRHQLTFGPGPLERQRFVAEACVLANRVAVFADRVCCRRTESAEVETAVTAPEHAAGVRDAVTALGKRVEVDGGTYARFLRRWYRTEVLHRLRGGALLRLPPDQRPTWIRELAALTAEHFDPELARGLPPTEQVVARVLAAYARDSANRGDDEPDDAGRSSVDAVAALTALAEWECTIDARSEVRWLRPTREGLEISVRVELSGHGAPVFRLIEQPDGSAVALDPPLTAVPTGTAPDAHGVRHHLDAARIEFLARAPDGSTVRTPARSVRFDGSGFRVWAEIPTLDAAGGRYRLDVRVRCCGWTRTAPVRASAAVLARQRRLHPPVPHVGHGPIAIDVPPHGGRPSAALCTDPPRLGLGAGLRTVLRTLGTD